MNEPDPRYLQRHAEQLERQIEANHDQLKQLDSHSLEAFEIRSHTKMLETMRDSAMEALRKEEPWRLFKAKRLTKLQRKLKVPMGIYHGWQTYYVIFARPHWLALRGENMLRGKTNFELTELIDGRDAT